MNQASLAQRVEQAQAGHRDAWGQVYRELAPSVYRLCRRVLPNGADAEDATMEIFLKAQMHLAQYDPARPFRPWLYRIAANHCWDRLRKHRRRKETAMEDLGGAELEATDPDPQEQLLARQSHQQIREAVRKLGDRARLAVMLRYFADLSYQEIADVMGINASFVGVLLLRARRRMRRLLKETP